MFLVDMRAGDEMRRQRLGGVRPRLWAKPRCPPKTLPPTDMAMSHDSRACCPRKSVANTGPPFAIHYMELGCVDGKNRGLIRHAFP